MTAGHGVEVCFTVVIAMVKLAKPASEMERKVKLAKPASETEHHIKTFIVVATIKLR